MRIAILMSMASPWARKGALALSQLGHDVHVICLASGDGSESYLSVKDDFQRENIDAFRRSVAGVHVIQSRVPYPLGYWLDASRLARVCKDCDAEVLLTLYGGGFALLAYLSGIRPYSIYLMGSDVLYAKGVKRWVTRRSLKSARLVLANGQHLADRARVLAPRTEVVPLYLGVDTDTFVPGEKPARPIRIVCTRGFHEVYNNAYLIQALALLDDSLPEFRVTFAAGGPLLNAAHVLVREILPPHVQEKIEFLGGVSEGAILEHLKGAHIYVSLSKSDGTSFSSLEALACGLFPVLSDIPPNHEWIQPSAGNGILVPLDKAQELAAALRSSLTDEALRERAGEYNRRLVVQRACIKSAAVELASLLRSAVESPRGPVGSSA